MLFFNVQKLETLAAGDDAKFIELFTIYANRVLTGKVKHASHFKIDLAGTGYLGNPHPFLEDRSSSLQHKVQYLRLAGRRDFAHLNLYGSKSLQLSYYPDIKLEYLKNNPLLIVTKTEILFKYEELKSWQLSSQTPKVRQHRAAWKHTSTRMAKTSSVS